MKTHLSIRHGVVAVTAALLLSACGAAPETPVARDSDFSGCLVTGAGQGIEDGSFNQLSYLGLAAAMEELGGEPSVAESAAEDAYAPNISNFVELGCDIIVGVGFELAEQVRDSAELNPGTRFAMVDDDSIDAENVKPITFASDQPAFLAGYAAASYSTTGVVGTFGGVQIPPVTLFMDGFARGIEHYNSEHGTDVRLVGWDPSAQTGTFTGGFESNEVAKTTAASLLDQNVDVLLPVGGPIFLAAGQAIRDSGRDVALIGVDADLAETQPDLSDLFLTSILKDADVAVNDVVLAAASGDFVSEPYVGTLENGGVSLAPFHAFADRVDPELESQLERVRAGIIDGTIDVSR